MSKPRHKKAFISGIIYTCPKTGEELRHEGSFYFGMDTLHSLGKEAQPYIVIHKCFSCTEMHIIDVERVNE